MEKSKIVKKLVNKYYYLYEKTMIWGKSREKELGTIWMFHVVSNNRQDWYDSKYSISTMNFERMLMSFLESGYCFRKLDELERTDDKSIYITFDDGFKCIYAEAYSILCKYKVPFCVFVTTNFIGQKGYLSYNELKEMSGNSLCTIGSHTISHAKLRTLNAKSSLFEIKQSGKILENMIGKKILYFAYPYGNLAAVSKRDCRFVEKAGYKFAFSTLQLPLRKSMIKDAYFISRLNINEKSYDSMFFK